MKPYTIYIFFLSIISLISCKSEIKEVEEDTSLLVNYYVRSYQTGNFVKAEAKFKYQADTGYVAVEAAKFQNFKMRIRDLENDVTWAVYEGVLDTTHGFDFEFMIGKDRKVRHTVPFKPVKTFSISGGIVDKSEGFIFNWEGDKIVQNETLVLFFTDSQGTAVTMNRLLNSANSSFEVAPPLLTDLAAGKGKVYVVRRSRVKLQEENGVNGFAELEYYTDDLEVVIQE